MQVRQDRCVGPGGPRDLGRGKSLARKHNSSQNPATMVAGQEILCYKAHVPARLVVPRGSELPTQPNTGMLQTALIKQNCIHINVLAGRKSGVKRHIPSCKPVPTSGINLCRKLCINIWLRITVLNVLFLLTAGFGLIMTNQACGLEPQPRWLVHRSGGIHGQVSFYNNKCFEYASALREGTNSGCRKIIWLFALAAAVFFLLSSPYMMLRPLSVRKRVVVWVFQPRHSAFFLFFLFFYIYSYIYF